MRVAVTGGSGKLGRSVVRRLREDGHEVTNLDRTGTRGPGFTEVDLRNYGQVVDVFLGLEDRHAGFDAVVHLAAIPAPGHRPGRRHLREQHAGHLQRVPGGPPGRDQEDCLRLQRDGAGTAVRRRPPYIPVDEEYPARPESTYSLVKHLEEQMAIQLTRWDPELSITGLRFSNVMDPEDYEEFPRSTPTPRLRKWNLWGYIDGRDGAQAVARALEHGAPGFEAFIIANADTVMSRSSASLAAEVFPDVPVVKELGEHETLLSIDKAKRLLGYAPEHSWRNYHPNRDHPHRRLKQPPLRSSMQYRTLGSSGAVVSNYALGTMTFGAEADEEHVPRHPRRLLRGGRQLHRHRGRLQRRRLGGDHRPLARRPRPTPGPGWSSPPRAASRWATAPNDLGTSPAAPAPGRWMPRCAGSASSTSTSTRCTPGTRSRRWRRRCASSTTRSASGKIAYYGFSNFLGWQLTKAVHARQGARLERAGDAAAAVQPAGPRHRARDRAGLRSTPASACCRGRRSAAAGSPASTSATSAPTGATRLGENPERGMEAWEAAQRGPAHLASHRRGAEASPRRTASARRRWRWPGSRRSRR